MAAPEGWQSVCEEFEVEEAEAGPHPEWGHVIGEIASQETEPSAPGMWASVVDGLEVGSTSDTASEAVIEDLPATTGSNAEVGPSSGEGAPHGGVLEDPYEHGLAHLAQDGNFGGESAKEVVRGIVQLCSAAEATAKEALPLVGCEPAGVRIEELDDGVIRIFLTKTVWLHRALPNFKILRFMSTCPAGKAGGTNLPTATSSRSKMLRRPPSKLRSSSPGWRRRSFWTLPWWATPW